RLTGGGLNGLVAAHDSRTLAGLAAGTYTFALDVTSTLPECATPQHREFTVTVTAPPPPPPVPCDVAIDTFTQSASCIAIGGQVTLSWTAHSNKSNPHVQINGAGAYPLNGSASFPVTGPQTFTLSLSTDECPATT